MNVPNPYATPVSEGPLEASSITALRELVKSWEKLRLIYNGILLLPGLGVLALLVTDDNGSIIPVVVFGLLCGLGANVAFLAGPLAELYLRVLLFRSDPTPNLRRSLFLGGLVLSLGIITTVAAVSWIA